MDTLMVRLAEVTELAEMLSLRSKENALEGTQGHVK